MSHRHFCDFAGHEWECEGTASRPFTGDMEPTTCMCLTHHTPMDIGDHSQCSIELLACPAHSEEQRRKMEEASKAEANIPEGWVEPFRPRTPEERMKFEAEHRFMEEVVYAGLENINSGFDAVGIFHFSPADFGKVIDRCEHLHVHPNGIEVFTTDGGCIEVVFAMDDGSPEDGFDWARRLVQRYKDTPEISMSATFNVPDSLLDPKYMCSGSRESKGTGERMNDDWVPLEVPDNLEEMFEAMTSHSGEKVGWCLLCNSPIHSESDLLPETGAHDCPAGREFEAKHAPQQKKKPRCRSNRRAHK